MTIKQDQLNPQTTSVTFEDLHNNITPARYLHNGSDFIKCEFFDDPSNPILRYYQTDGDKAAAFAMDEPNQLDITYEPNTGKYYSIRYFVASDVTQTGVVINPDPSGINRSFDDFEGSGVFIPNTVNQILFRDAASNPSKLTLQRPLGSPTVEQSVRSNVDLKGDTLISGVFTSTVDYEMPLASVVSVQDALVSLRTYDTFNENERFSVGVMSSGTGNSETLKYTIALSGTEDVSSNSLTRFEYIEVDHKAFIDWKIATGFTTFNVVVTQTGSVSPDPNWDITTPQGTQTYSSATGEAGAYTDPYIRIGLVNPTSTTGGDPVLGSGSESISFSVNVYASQDVSTTGTLSISRTSGTSPTYTNDDTAHSYVYSIFDFFANEELYQELYGYTEQFDLVSALFDNYAITSGAVQDDHLSDIITTTTTRTISRRLNVEEIDDEGNILDVVISDFDVLDPLVYQQVEVNSPFSTTSGVVSGTESLTSVAITADSTTGYIYSFDSVFAFNLATTYAGTTSGTSSGIVASTITSGSALDFQFNPNSGGFIQYQTKAAGENLLRTLDISVSSGVTNSNREVFLNFPDSHLDDDHVFLHGSDPNTLFYFRRNGDNLNVLKVSSSCTIAGLILNDPSASFITVSNVQKGDDVYISSLDQHFVVDQVLDENNVRLETAPSSSSYSYRLYAGAEQLQFNIDTELSAFASVNVDDFSLRAGTSDNTIVTAEVINAWGDPLSGKTVSFIVSNGDGAVSPANDSTDGTGKAFTTYNAGVTPGPVEITATVSD